MLIELGWIGAGLLLLYWGAEGLVGGSSRVAIRLGISPLIVGLTLVAYGTSAPEMVVSVKSAMAGQSGLAAGNVVGSNIFNIAFILGLCSLVRPSVAHSQIVKLEIPIMIAATGLALGLIADGRLGRVEAIVLLAGLAAYTGYNVWQGRLQHRDLLAEEFAVEMPKPRGSAGWDVLFILGGLVLLVVGGRWFVDGAVGLARRFGVEETVIGLTIVAAGTSLPELATSMLAAIRRENEIAVGNIVGSNIFNLVGILGVAALIHPLDVAGISRVDLAMMLGTAVILLPLMRSGFRINRWEAAFLLAGYSGYLYYLLTSSRT